MRATGRRRGSVSDQPPDQTPDQAPKPETEWERKRRIAAVFGDVLPETTSDERDAGEGARGSDTAADAWLKAQVPPHHGG